MGSSVHLSISAVRADALFVSALQCSEEPTAGQVRRAVAAAIGSFGGRGCVARVAQEFGDHPELAAERMRWAAALTRDAFPGMRPGRASGRPATRRPVRALRAA